ncbi:hypothetical protein J1614_009354 [Plenodomus biglobosus]|nr:hypothetical protein J1614_009354 [Plenodomus biglobosus]
MQFFPLFIACAVGAAVIKEQQQVPFLENVDRIESDTRHVQGKELERPSIGVHFTSSHVVPAARYSNGTTLDLRSVEGDDEYIDLMSQWMAPNLQLVGRKRGGQVWCKTHPHYQECTSDDVPLRSTDEFDDPTSRDTAILSKIIMQVRISIEAELRMPITAFAPVFFELRQNQTQIVQNAMELVGLRSTHSSDSTRGDVLLDTTAAYAGVGALSCQDRMNSERCRKEKSTKREHTVLFLDFDSHSFSASVRRIHNEATSHSIGPRVLSPELGWWNLPDSEVPRAKFWARVHEAIFDMVRMSEGKSIDRIVLTGQHGADEEFKGVVEAVITSTLEMDVGSILLSSLGVDTGRIVARGAAEMAWRREYWRRKAGAD